jgi:hypothetical protein
VGRVLAAGHGWGLAPVPALYAGYRRVRPYPLLMVGIYAFMLALSTFGVVLVWQVPQPLWTWALNAIVIASELVALVWCYHRATAR